jgi:PKD repeat protein
MPTIIGIFVSLTAFNIGERSKRKFGLESAFLIGFIPTTIRFLGPSFYVAVAIGLLLLIFVIWAGQLKKMQGSLLMAAGIWLMFVIHPPTALAGIIIMLIFPVFLTMEKKYKSALITGIFSALAIISIIVLHYFTETWDYYIENFLQATYGKEYFLGLPEIWINFEYLGVLTWLLFVIGVYYSISIGKSLKRTLSLSSIVFIIIIGVYSKLNYGVPIIYERTFLYLFILVTLIAGVGLSELRRTIENIAKKNIFKKFKQLSKNSGSILAIAVCGSLLVTAIPTHMEIPYYQMIDEKDYEAFVWIENNIDDYRDENHPYEKAAVHPFKASPFSAITGLYILSSTMHPTYGYNLHTDMEKFLNEKCINISFLEKYQLSVIYGHCNNEYSEEVYENVYLYRGVPPTANFTFAPNNPSLNETINFTSNFTTSYGRIVTWEWDFGDGTTGYGETTGLEFDGIYDYVEIQDDPSLDISNSITLEMWIKPKIKSQKMVVIGKQRSYQIWCSNSRWYFGVFNESSYHGSEYSSTATPPGKWAHVVGVYDSNLPNGQIQIWVDSIKENSCDYNGSIRNNDGSFRIGGGLAVWKDSYFNGNIADVRIYKRALTPDEISQNFNSTSDESIVTNGLVSWWKMKNMGKTTYDIIGNNDGDIFGAKWINRASHKYDQSGTYNVTLTVLNERGLDYSISKNVIIH